jgi:hypothetical protein
MAEQGNIKANSYWECNVFPFEKPLAHDPSSYRKKYIVEKYVKKKFVPSEGNTTNKLEREFKQDLVDKKGMLTKQGAKNKNWKKRWAKLSETKLSYFANQTDSYPKGECDIEPDSMIMFVDENQIAKKNCFAIVTQKRNFYIYTDIEEDMCSWVYHLRASVYYGNLKRVLDDPRNFLKGGATKSVEKRGMLKKQGGRFASIKKRYFVLKDGMMNYYKTDKDLEPIDSIDLRGTKVEEKTNRISKEYGMVLHTEKRQFFFVADTPGEQAEWIEAIQSVCKSLSEAETIQNKSSAIHTLILTRMIHGKESKVQDGVISPHSPLMWRTLSFHRCKPQYLEGSSNTVMTTTPSSTSSLADNNGSQEVSLLKRVPTAQPVRGTSVPDKLPRINSDSTTNSVTRSPSVRQNQIPQFNTPSVVIEDEKVATPAYEEQEADKLGEDVEISEIDLKKQKNPNKLKDVVLKKNKEKQPTNSSNEKQEAMDKMMRDPMSSHLQGRSPSHTPATPLDDDDDFSDLMEEEERITDKNIQLTPISQAFKLQDDGRNDYSDEELVDENLYDDDDDFDDEMPVMTNFTTIEIAEPSKPTLKLKKNIEEASITLTKKTWTRDKDTPSTFKKMQSALEQQFRILGVNVN